MMTPAAAPRLLVSVRDCGEALAALEAGADFIDLKEPSLGALGAVDPATVSACVTMVAGRRPVSATIGDVPFHAAAVLPPVLAHVAAGVDYIKIGIAEEGDARPCLDALSQLSKDGVKMVAVFFADAMPASVTVADIAAAGFAGAMLDTARKAEGRLTDIMGLARISAFVADARRHGLMTGLAGSLDAAAAAAIAPLRPDYLGFRGALCRAGNRGGAFDAALFTPLKAAILAASRYAAA